MRKIAKYVSLILLAFILTSTAFAGVMQMKGNNLKETQFGRIKLFDKKDTVIKKMGKPYSIKYDEIFDSTDIYYKGLIFQLDSKGYVIEIRCTSKKFPTYRGIKIGSKKSDLVKRYGKPTLEDKTSHYLQYNSTEYQGWVYCLRFYISKDRVTKISSFDPWGNGL